MGLRILCYILNTFPVDMIRSFATTVSELKICDFSGETFKGFEMP